MPFKQQLRSLPKTMRREFRSLGQGQRHVRVRSRLKWSPKQSKKNRRLKSRVIKVAGLLGFSTAIVTVISVVSPIEWIKVADCSLGFQCQLFRQETLIASIYGWNPNVLYRENFGLMLVVYGIAIFSYLKFMFEGVSLIKK